MINPPIVLHQFGAYSLIE